MSFLKEVCSTAKVRLIFIAILLWILYTLYTLYDFSTVTWTHSSTAVPFPYYRSMNQIYPSSPEYYVDTSTLSSLVPTELTPSLSSPLYAAKDQKILDTLLQKSPSQLSSSELAQFYSIKEAQYETRRARVRAYCDTQDKRTFSRRIYRHLLYDKQAGTC